ncbi:CBS domain [Musa troglodytarum]|uniref:CBS domain n=1 Tax=Musa troglodytarum TaxID=320322 RepID=A0A9E7KCJ6_9LILI|nr:CBS domain [Musa troglodytarum]
MNMEERKEERKAREAAQGREAEVVEEGLQGNKKMRRGACGWLRERKVRDLVRDRRRLVEVPYTATLAHTVNALVANRVSAVPVAAPPGQWIGAGGSMILESDRATGAVRKHYIGMVTMLDLLAHIAENGDQNHGAGDESSDGPERDLERRMSVPVSSIIGHSLEGLSLWTLNPTTSILDCMETFSKGVHRALIPLESRTNHAIAVELVEASPGYRMLTQMDVISFLREQNQELKGVLSHSVLELGAIGEVIFSVSKHTKVMDTIRSMRAAGLSAVPVVEAPSDDQILQDGKGKRLIETFSATDLRGCPVVLLQSGLSLSVTEFKERLSMRGSNASIAPPMAGDDPSPETRRLITCSPETSLSGVIVSAASNHVHRLWVVDGEGLLQGVVSLTDMLRVVRDAVLRAEQELEGIVQHG